MKAVLLLLSIPLLWTISDATRAQAPDECRSVETNAKHTGRFCLSRANQWVLVSSNLERTTAGINVPGCARPAPLRGLPASNAGNAAFEETRLHLLAVRDFTRCVGNQANAAGSSVLKERLLDLQRESAAEFNVYMQLFTQLWREKGSPATPAGVFIEGTHYIALKTPHESKADVVMFTTLECRTCDYEELLLDQFRKKYPNVSVAIVSGRFGYSQDGATHYSSYAKAELIAARSGGTWRDRLRKALRDAGAKPLAGDEDVRQTFLRLGYDAQRLDELLESASLKLNVIAAEADAAKLGVWSMPTFLVRGRYLVPQTMVRADGSTVTNPKKLLDVVEYLLKQPATTR